MSNRLVGGAIALAALLFAIILLWGPVSQEFTSVPKTNNTPNEPSAVATAGADTSAGIDDIANKDDGAGNAEPTETEPDTSAQATTSSREPTAAVTSQAKAETDEQPTEGLAGENDAAKSREDADAPAVLKAGAPEFDVLRVDESGFALAAGRAAANTDVRIFVGDTLAATTRAGPDGAFVAYFQTPPAEGAQPVRAETDSGPSDGPATTDPLFILSSTEPDEAPIIVEPAPQGVVVVQPAPRIANDVVSLDQITYDEDGRVSFAGRGEGAIILYLDNQKIAEAFAADDGSWRTLAAGAIEPGVYALRVDQLGDDGSVTSRLETPFQREDIEQGDIGENAFTVQAGNNLWRLAETVYGEGARYTVIFDANRDAIRNPDLIYPGQIFVIPDEKRTDLGGASAD